MLVISSVRILKDSLYSSTDRERHIKYEKEKVANAVGVKICGFVPFCEYETEEYKQFEQRLQVFAEPIWQEFRHKLFNRLSALTTLELRKMFEELDASLIRQRKEENESNG